MKIYIYKGRFINMNKFMNEIPFISCLVSIYLNITYLKKLIKKKVLLLLFIIV